MPNYNLFLLEGIRIAKNCPLQFTEHILGTKDVTCPSIEVIYSQAFDETAEEKSVYNDFQ